MNIEVTKTDIECRFGLSGRLDTNTAPELEAEIKACFDKVMMLTFDFARLEYISSAGIRVMLASHKKMMSQGGSVRILNVNEAIREVFKITGMDNILTIE